MKKTLFLSVAFIGLIFVSCSSDTEKTSLETPKSKHSYAIGMDMGRGIKQIDPDLLDYSIVIQGMKDMLDTARPVLMNDSEFVATLQNFMLEMRKAPLAKNLKEQNAFLEKNKGEAGVISTESGLQYMILSEGSGDVAKDGDTITVHYVGTLLDGTKFDSSIDKNQPITVALSDRQFIQGWVEMLRLMKKGDKVKLWVPSNLGYGENNAGPIPGNSLLIFEMELLEVKSAK